MMKYLKMMPQKEGLKEVIDVSVKKTERERKRERDQEDWE